MTISALPDVLWNDGDDNMGGIQTTAYYARISDFTSTGIQVPSTLSSATTLAQLATVSVAHTFKSGKGFKRFYCTEDAGMVEVTQQGELDGKSFLNKIKLTHPGGSATLLGFQRLFNNAGMMWLAKDAEGLTRQVGNQQYPAKVVANNHTTTETAAGRKALTLEVQHSSPYPAPVYTASIEFENSAS
jgi:hypothetical protein